MSVNIERGHDQAGAELILRALPAWFGIDEAVVQYVADAGRLPGYLARDNGTTVGIALVNRHYPESAEIHLIAVHPDHHRRGIGSALLRALTADLALDGVRMLQVHTVGPSFPDAGYERTRAFYLRNQFVPLQEFDQLDWAGPTQILVAALPLETGREHGGGHDLVRFSRWQFDTAWNLLHQQLRDLSDAAFRWPEAAPNWWTVRALDDGRFVADWVEPEPSPPPPVTVAWLTWYMCWWWRAAMDGLRDTQPAEPTEVTWPGSAQATVQALQALRVEWLDLVDDMGPEQLSGTAVFPWNDRSDRTAAHVVWWVNSELMKNTAEIGQLMRIRALELHDR